MSLLNDASLILTPNAVKEGKLYSIIPTNGNGDMTVVRATGATRTNELGLIEFTPYNLFVRSDEFENSSWVKQLTSVTVNSTISPNGLMNADTVTSTTTGQARVEQSLAVPTINTTYTFSTYAKASSSPFVALTRFSGIFVAIFNLSSGTIVNQTAGVNATIISVGNGWYRISITVNALTTDSNSVWKIHPCTSTDAFSSVVGNSIFLWGAQLVQGSVPKDYFYTTDRLNVPRLNYDVAGGCPSILVEPQRTNLTLRSEEFENAIWTKVNASITSNVVISPNNTLTADKLIPSATASVNKYIYQTPTTSNGVNHSITVFAKLAEYNRLRIEQGNDSRGAWFNLSNGTIGTVSSGATAEIKNMGDGWYRCSVNVVSVATNVFFLIGGSNTESIQVGDGTSGIYIWGAQLEAGSYATSYVPTVATSVTRNADVITRNNIYTNNLITSAGGTWFIELDNNVSLTRDVSGNGIWIGDNSTISTIGNSFNIRHNGGTSRLSINKAVVGTLTGLYVTLTNTVKIAIDWNGTTADVFVNGVKVVTGTAFTATNMEFLNSGGGGGCVPKYIKSMMLFPRPLTDAECIALTSYFFNSYLDMAKYLNYTIQ